MNGLHSCLSRLCSTLICKPTWSLLPLLVILILSAAGSAQTTPPYGLRVLASNFPGIEDIAVDSHGNAYVADDQNQMVTEYLAVDGVIPAAPTVRSLGTGFTEPRSVAIDKAGDVFVSNEISIVELLAVNGSVPDNPTVVTIYTTIAPASFSRLRVDGLGSLNYAFYADGVTSLHQIAAVDGIIPTNPTPRLLFADLGGLFTEDGKGDLYLQELDGDFYELVAVNGVIPDNPVPQKVLDTSALPNIQDIADIADIAVDASGNIFLAEVVSAETCALVEVSAVNGVIPANPTFTTLYTAPQATFRADRIAIDAKDNMYIEDDFASTQAVGGFERELAEVSPTVAPAGVTLTPSTFNYGSVDLSSSANETFTLANAGSAGVDINSASLPSSIFTIASTTCGSSLAASSSCTYKIEFAPTAVGAVTATFTVTDDDGTQTASLSGTGAAVTAPTAPEAALTPSSQNFGSVTVGSSSAAKTFTLANAGTASLPITSVAITGANVSSFTLNTNACGSTLAPGASCTVSISFKPGAAGSDSASLTVIDSVGTQASALAGTGEAVVNPDFAIAATPATQTIAAGGTADYTLSITPTGGFDSSVALTAMGLPPGSTVTFSPGSVTPNGAASSSTMAIHVSSQTTVSNNATWKLGAPALAAVFLLLPFRRLRKWRGMLCALIFTAALLGVGGCGGGFGLGSSPTSATYTVKVTGTSGSLTHSATVQITVQTAVQSTQMAAE